MAKGSEALISNDAYMTNVWQMNNTVAERYNDPGTFTSLIGYEWTSQPGGGNLHRVVIFRDDKTLTDKILPFSAFDSEEAEDLWAFMAATRNRPVGVCWPSPTTATSPTARCSCRSTRKQVF